MTNPYRTNQELLEENALLKQRIQKLEQSKSDRKQVEEALRESEERYHRIADTVTDYIFTSYIEDGKVVKTVHGPGCIAVTGYSAEEFDADPYLWFNMVFPEDRDRVKKYASLILTGKNLDPVEHRIRRKGGRVRWVLNTPVPHHASSGALISYDGLISDITLRKRAEEALRESEENYRILFEGINDAVFVHDLDEEGLPERFLQVNDVACRRLGYTREELLSLTPRDITMPEEYERIADKRIGLASQGDILMETIHVTKDGLKVPVESNIRQFQYLGKQVALSISRDITDRRQAEAEKAKLEAQNQQLQKAESLSRMAGAIAHHFNNQLGVVIGNLEMAIDDLPLGAEPIENLITAMEASNRAAEMSGLLLTYLGQSFDERESLHLSDACLLSLTILRAVILGKVRLEADLPSPGPIIMANAKQIQQVLTNMVTNGWEAIGDGRGVIYLSIKTVSPAEIAIANRYPIGWQSQESDYACMEVTDTGCGIEDKDIEKLFDPFFSTKFTGRGLGLAVVMGIVRAHSGVVTVESEPDRGSTFRVFLPVSTEEVIRQPDNGGDILISSVYPIEMEEGGTVLLVEDEEMLREMAAAMLKRLGFSVLAANDGVEAVEVFRQHHDEICCVLCDLTMPRMNGWETLTALRKLAPGLPVILASGYDKAHVMAGDHPELPQVFLGKPYKFKGLSDAISQALINKKK